MVKKRFRINDHLDGWTGSYKNKMAHSIKKPPECSCRVIHYNAMNPNVVKCMEKAGHYSAAVF